LFTLTSEFSGGQKVGVGIILLAYVHDSGPRARKNISGALSFAHKSGKACGKNRKSTTNPPNFNAMMRFAPFLCNRILCANFFLGISK
jgi:hypothetical protein